MFIFQLDFTAHTFHYYLEQEKSLRILGRINNESLRYSLLCTKHISLYTISFQCEALTEGDLLRSATKYLRCIIAFTTPTHLKANIHISMFRSFYSKGEIITQRRM